MEDLNANHSSKIGAWRPLSPKLLIPQ